MSLVSRVIEFVQAVGADIKALRSGKEDALPPNSTQNTYLRGGTKTWVDLATSVRGILLAGLNLASPTAITTGDTILGAFGKLQAQVTGLQTALTGKAAANDARLATAWVNFNGTGTVAIRSQNNVASITDLGVGYYFINFAVPMDNVNYVVAWAFDTDQDGVSDMSVAVGAPQRLFGMVESRKTVNGFPVYCGAQNNGARLDYRSIQLIIMGGKAA